MRKECTMSGMVYSEGSALSSETRTSQALLGPLLQVLDVPEVVFEHATQREQHTATGMVYSEGPALSPETRTSQALLGPLLQGLDVPEANLGHVTGMVYSEGPALSSETRTSQALLGPLHQPSSQRLVVPETSLSADMLPVSVAYGTMGQATGVVPADDSIPATAEPFRQHSS
jgi:predicted solute-binding protein